MRFSYVGEHFGKNKTGSNGQKALEDIKAEHGAMVRPSGPPVSLGPNVNPFWSGAARERSDSSGV